MVIFLPQWNVHSSFSSVQFSHSVVSDYAIPWTAARQASLFITNSQSPPKPMSIELMMPSNHLILCCLLLLLSSIFPSIRVLSKESALRTRWPKDCSFSFNISPSNEYPGLISFRMDWLDLLAGQGTLKSLQHHSSKASIVLCLKSLSTQRRLLPWTLIPAPWSIKYLNFQEKVNYFWSHTNLVNMKSAEEWFIRK